MSQTLFEEIGPNGNVQAVVEADDAATYFYLYATEETDQGMKSVWVRNHVSAPPSIDRERMIEGHPPLNPRQHCRFPDGQLLLKRELLRVTWLPEGNGVALLEGDELLAIIPPWSGQSGFHGYARDNIGEGPLAWALPAGNALIERFVKAEEYWRMWDGDLWPSIQQPLVKKFRQALGEESKYYAIDGGRWPPKALLRIPISDGVALVTVGVCLRPQPNVELSTDTPEFARRIELGVLLPPSWTEREIVEFGSYISGQASLPWNKYTWLGNGHTIPCDSWRNKQFEFALLTSSHPVIPQFDLEPIFGDPVNLLWFLPITEHERQLAIDQGSAVLESGLPLIRWKRA